MICELIDTDLEAVAGGTSTSLGSRSRRHLDSVQNNSLNQTGVALGGSVVQVAGPHVELRRPGCIL